MDKKIAFEIVLRHGINPKKPMIVQVSRFDPFKNQHGVIKAYRILKEKFPDLQLVLAGFLEAKDDPEAVFILEEIKKDKGEDKDIHLFYDFSQLKKVSHQDFIRALWAQSDVVVQASLKEGFGLVITEAMWQRKPLVANINSGSRLQVKNDKTGLLVSSAKNMAKAIEIVLKNKNFADKLGAEAKKSVKKRFLINKYILDNLKLYDKLSSRF